MTQTWISTTRQHPVGSPFGPEATATDVLAGIDLTGTRAVVTAGHTGIGREVTRALSAAGATVTVGVRAPERATEVAALPGVTVARLDLLDLDSIDAFAAGIVHDGHPLQLLINGAALTGPATVQRDARGNEAQLATTHLGHLALTRALWPALTAAQGARVVTVSSGAQRMTDILWDDPNFERTPYDGQLAYAQSKTANVLFTVELDRRGAADGVRAYAVHPGIVVGTSLNDSVGLAAQQAMGLVDADGRPIIDPARGRKTPAQGASTIVFAATSPLLDGIGGVYLSDNDVTVLDVDPQPVDLTSWDAPPTAVVPHSVDPDSARRLWTLSERLLGLPETSAHSVS